MSRLVLNGVRVEVVRKRIKHLHLGVYPPEGHVRIAAPIGVPMDAIRLFAIGRLSWIKRQQARFAAQARDPEPEYIDRESHFLWGRRYLLRVVEGDRQVVRLRARTIDLQVVPGWDVADRQAALEAWYRSQLRAELPPLLDKWERLLRVRPKQIYLQRMKTKWGSCNIKKQTIRLNTELARKPKEYLEYILVHEVTHLIEPTHGPRFSATLDRALPQWRDLREALNSLPLRNEVWTSDSAKW